MQSLAYRVTGIVFRLEKQQNMLNAITGHFAARVASACVVSTRREAGGDGLTEY